MLGKKRKAKERPRTHAEINEFRRSALIRSTIESLAEHGVGGTSVRSICAGADSSRGLIMHYFQTKEEMLAAAFRHLYTSVAQHVLDAQERVGDDPKAKLHALPQSVFSPEVFSSKIRNAFLTFWHEIRFNPFVRNANRELYGDYKKRTEEYFRLAAEECGVSIDTHQAAIGLVAMIDGLWLVMAIFDRLVTRETAIMVCRNYIDLQLGQKPTKAS
jgi:TetR/AcrR family transcriptional repressor of bet genes